MNHLTYSGGVVAPKFFASRRAALKGLGSAALGMALRAVAFQVQAVTKAPICRVLRVGRTGGNLVLEGGRLLCRCHGLTASEEVHGGAS